MAVDPTTLLNFIFCVIIVILGIWVYKAKKVVLALYVALAFGLFGISHLAILLGVKSTDIYLIIIRALAYLVIIYTLTKQVIHYRKSTSK